MSPQRESAGRPRQVRAPHGHHGNLLAAACLTASLAGCSMDGATFQESFERNWEGTEVTQAGDDTVSQQNATDGQAGNVLPASSVPAVLEIPRIGVRQEVLELGLQYDGTLDVPEQGGDVGWYSPDARPGSDYPTIFTGHVDTPAGPAVFARLLELEPGDEVAVIDVGGEIITYRVERVEDHPVNAYPTMDVFGPAPEDEIRLITCTGVFEVVPEQYDQNRVVYASRSE